jgi:hypothetical protein
MKEGFLHQNFATLTQLTTLILTEELPCSSLSPILGLPLLKELAVDIADNVQESAGLILTSTHLTSLVLHGGKVAVSHFQWIALVSTMRVAVVRIMSSFTRHDVCTV